MKMDDLKSEYLTVGEVGQYLHISQSNAYNLTHRKDFPVCRLGGTIRIPKSLFLAWVEKCTRIPSGLVSSV